MADTGSGRLPQWWLDSTPHDTLEDKVERQKKEEERIAKEREASGEIVDDGVASHEEDVAHASLDAALDEVSPQPSQEDAVSSPTKPGYTRTLKPKGPEDFETEYEQEDYTLERSKLKPPRFGETGESSGTPNEGTSADSEGQEKPVDAMTSPVRSTMKSPAGNEPEDVLSPMSQTSTATNGSLTSPRKQRQFKTAFTGIGPFDFAMQQRAREQERREKERQARESLSRHHADKVEVDRVTETKAKTLEQRRKKKEAEDMLKGFKKVALDDKLDKAPELKRLHLELKRKKKEAETQHHEYKGS